MNAFWTFWMYVVACLAWLGLMIYLTVKSPHWLKVNPAKRGRLRLVFIPPLLGASLAVAWWAVKPSEQQRAQEREQERLRCLDAHCPGDPPLPDYDHTKYSIQKLNGKLFLGPKEYFNGMGIAAFQWWRHKPLTTNDVLPPEVLALLKDGKGDDISIVIFLHRRVEVSPKVSQDRGLPYFERAKAEGRVVNKEVVRPGLETWRIKEEIDLDPGVWYVAAQYVKQTPEAAVLWCSETKLEFCTTGELLMPGISWDARFSSRHAQDWPEIHQEIVRVLSLLREIQT